MDFWLTNEIKELLAQPCLDVSSHIGTRLNSRLKLGQNIREEALTEDFVDRLDTRSDLNVWGKVLDILRDRGIYLSTNIRKSTKEYENGADVGIILNRSVYKSPYSSSTQYACLIQCKKIDNEGVINDFFHEVGSAGKKQSSLLLDITPSSYYFIFVPTLMLQSYAALEPIFFLQVGESSSPVWNMGHFEHNPGSAVMGLTEAQKASSAGILVVPALAVEAQKYQNKKIALVDLLPNCVPFWYWFAELFVPAFIGDRSPNTIAVASNKATKDVNQLEFGVKYTLEVSVGTG